MNPTHPDGIRHEYHGRQYRKVSYTNGTRTVLESRRLKAGEMSPSGVPAAVESRATSAPKRTKAQAPAAERPGPFRARRALRLSPLARAERVAK